MHDRFRAQIAAADVNAARAAYHEVRTVSMRRQTEWSRAIAEAVALCRPQIVPAYPITPQTHIVEAVGAMVKEASLEGCEFITVEPEFAAMSAAIGAETWRAPHDR